MTGRGRLLRSRLRQRCLVTLKSGEAFAGTLWDADSRVLILKNAAVYDPSLPAAAPTPVDGEVLLLLPDVSYLQIP